MPTNDFDDDFHRVSRLAGVSIIVGVLVSLAVTGLGIWAVVELVQWVTTK